jgi:hypothetical protein
MAGALDGFDCTDGKERAKLLSLDRLEDYYYFSRSSELFDFTQ